VAKGRDAASEANDPAAPILDPDARLMMRVCQGDSKAFETLVDNYRDRLVGILYHLVGSADEAEDLAQEVFLRVYRSRDRYQPSAKFSTWLFTIANNLALNAIRDRKRRRSTEVAGTESGPLGPRPLENLASAPSGAMPSRVFAKGEMAEIVRAAVATLSDEQRMAIMLNKFEDMNYRQIAEIMDKSEMAIKSLLSRARNTLREVLEPYLANGERPIGL
jgi:RNA polymerase sigma-70 factor (ECF subfamily)